MSAFRIEKIIVMEIWIIDRITFEMSAPGIMQKRS